MRKTENVILTNMCMVYSGSKILVQDRLDPKWPGITFPGGHIEPGESFIKSTIREVKEETGLDISDLRICGVKQFTSIDNSYRYIVFFYKTDIFTGKLKSSDEGNVFWIERSELNSYTLAEGFDKMLEIFENDGLSENYHYFDTEWKCENL
ncbi:MAG: 8-oxo-dGTP diphosphatase [Ruminococcaceae bacterium]|nr:8-oxo-dGTP diphosphatase [Oscillospiraceae bacterium]